MYDFKIMENTFLRVQQKAEQYACKKNMFNIFNITLLINRQLGSYLI